MAYILLIFNSVYLFFCPILSYFFFFVNIGLLCFSFVYYLVFSYSFCLIYLLFSVLSLASFPVSVFFFLFLFALFLLYCIFRKSSTFSFNFSNYFVIFPFSVFYVLLSFTSSLVLFFVSDFSFLLVFFFCLLLIISPLTRQECHYYAGCYKKWKLNRTLSIRKSEELQKYERHSRR